MSAKAITGLLTDWADGKRDAEEELFALVEDELKRMAHQYMRRFQPGNVLQTTAVINETYVRLASQNRVCWQNRAHFFGIAANMMRRILLNYARDQQRLKRGGDNLQVSLHDAMTATPAKSDEILALEEALCQLAELDERKSRVVELRYFGGLSVAETAEVLNVSKITVNRDWNLAKAWLAKQIRNER